MNDSEYNAALQAIAENARLNQFIKSAIEARADHIDNPQSSKRIERPAQWRNVNGYAVLPGCKIAIKQHS